MEDEQDLNDSVNNTSKSKEPGEMPKKRFLGLDYLRGLGIIGIVFIHSSVYQFGRFSEIDIDDLNFIFLVFYVLINWGGLFVLISAIVNTYSSYNRFENKLDLDKKNFAWSVFGKRWSIYGIVLIFLNYVYSYFTGPMFYNFETKEASFSFLPGVIRTEQLYKVSVEHILQGSILSAIGWNLIILGLVLTIIFRKKRKNNLKKIKAFFLSFGSFIIFLSFFRIYLFALFENAVETKKYFLAYLIDLVGGEYFPLLPYLGYGLLGTYIGLLLAERPSAKVIKKHMFFSLLWIIMAIIAFVIPDQVYDQLNLLENIFLSYIVVLFEVGIFLFAISLFLLRFDINKGTINDRKKKIHSLLDKIILSFSTNSLTIFLLERPVAEIFAKIIGIFCSSWNHNIWACIVFGALMVLIWSLILLLLKRSNSKISIEFLLIQFLTKLGHETDKQWNNLYQR